MERHEGKIEIQSKPGQGTTMRLLFPVRDLELSDNTEMFDDDKPVGPFRILCIDDERIVISDFGFAVKLAPENRL